MKELSITILLFPLIFIIVTQIFRWKKTEVFMKKKQWQLNRILCPDVILKANDIIYANEKSPKWKYS